MSTDSNAATWSASDLCSEVWRACHMPEGGTVDYPAAVILRDASDVIWNFAGHALAQAREGRLATSLLRAVTAGSIVTSGQDYELPPMAVGDAIETVTWVDASGNRTLLQPVPVGLETTFSSPTSTGTPAYFAMLGDVLRVYPRPAASGSLEIGYQRRHGQLVLAAETATVSSEVTASGFARVTLSATPAAFVQNAWIDFIGSNYPYRTKLHGAVITTVHGSNQFTLSTTHAAFVAAQLTGDTAVAYGKTPFVQLPMELRSAVTKMIAAKILGDVGDAPMAAQREAAAERDMQRARQVLSPRSKKQKAFNPNSLGRSMARRGIPKWRDS